MTALLRHRVTLVWLLLMLATGLSWELGHGLGFGDNHHRATMAVVVIAFIKARFVFLEFMELRTAPLPLRLAFEAWTILVCGTLLVLYGLGFD
ncbi:MAG: cytochrome C oxidase subunit IV family protein [Porticoccaceae bacterium]